MCSAVENLNCGVPRRSKSKSKQAQALPQEHTCPHSSQWASGMKFPECEGEFKNSLMLRVGSDIVISIVHVIKRPCEVWCLRGDLFNRLRSFHKRCVRSMCRVSLLHAFHHHISSATLFQRLNVMDLDSYYHNRILRWAGHVARMPMTRAPRQLLTGWVAHSRPNGCPEVTWGQTLKKALKCKGPPANFKDNRWVPSVVYYIRTNSARHIRGISEDNSKGLKYRFVNSKGLNFLFD